MSNLFIGWSEANITPDKKVSLYGQFYERISEYIEKPLTATVFAVECENDQMILCSADLVGISYNLKDAIKEKLSGNTEGIDPEKIIICATHVHTGPAYTFKEQQSKYFAGESVDVLKKYLRPGQKYIPLANTQNADVATEEEVFELLTESISDAILEAWRTRRPGKFVNGFERAVVGLCRRSVYSDGTGQMWGDTNTAVFSDLEGGSDSGVELLYAFDDENNLTGVISNLSCTAQCVQHRNFVSPDFWGEAKKLVREYFKNEKLYLLPLCAPAGDQCPIDLVRWVNPETDVHDPNIIRHNPPVRKADPSMFDLSGMRKAGKRVARAIIDAYEEGLSDFQEDVPFKHQVHVFQLPLRRTTLSEYNNAVERINDYLDKHPGDVTYMDTANLHTYLGIAKRFIVQEKMETVEAEVHIVRLGSVCFATNPFELFLKYGNQIRSRQLCEQSFLIQLANGMEGYLPSEAAEKHGHYSGAIGSGQAGHEAGDLLVRDTLKFMNQLFEDDYEVYRY